MGLIKPIENIKILRKLVIGNIKIKSIDLPVHVSKLSFVLPIHESALKAVEHSSIENFVNEKSIKELKKISDWESVPLSLARPFLDINLEVKAVKVRENGNEVIIRLLADKNVRITGNKVSFMFEGNKCELPLATRGVMEGTTAIISPPIVPVRESALNGRPASYSIGFGRAYVPTRPDVSKFPSSDITDEMIDKEVEEAEKAFKVIADKYRALPDNGKNKAIAGATLLILDAVCVGVVKLIEGEKMNFKKALEQAFKKPLIDSRKGATDEKQISLRDEYESTFEKLILARHDELPDLLAGVESVFDLHNGEKVVLICKTVDPVEAASIDPNKIAAIVEEKGGILSHTTIVCKSQQIPLVIGVSRATEIINNGQAVIVDGERGKVIVDPTKDTLDKFMAIKEESEKVRAFLQEKYKGRTAKTKDGVEIRVLGNSETIAESERLVHEGIVEIGLFRTELSMDVDLVGGTIVKRMKEPSLNEQVLFYSRIFKTIGKGKQVVIRTMDINGDKYITYLGEPQRDMFDQTKEGIGLCLDERNHKPYHDLFKDQIKAILIAAKKEGAEPIIEFPMILSVDQFEQAKKVVKKAMKEMKEDKVNYESNVKYYAMVEHPELMRATNKVKVIEKEKEIIEKELEIDELARVADGLSLGTNDLTMKTLFENRYSARTKFNELHPDVLSSIAKTNKAAKNANKHLVVCGNMASDLISVPVLLGLGIRELSVDASSGNIIKSLVSNIDIKICEKLVDEIKEIKTADEARRFVVDFIMTRMEHGDEERGDWSGLKELENILKKYAYLSDGTAYKSEKGKDQE